MTKREDISLSVIKRLPRYYRFLGILSKQGITRISSKELAARMGLTASQIRHDFNCFGGFGQQGYGYNVKELYNEIGNILCVNSKLKTILIGAGNLGKSIATRIFHDNSGFQLIGIFDKNEALSGNLVQGIPIRNVVGLEDFCRNNKPDVAVICIPDDNMGELANQLIDLDIKSFWNFSHYDFALHHPEVLTESVHLSDSLMTLGYLTNTAQSRGGTGDE